jgi:hypothetical protein
MRSSVHSYIFGGMQRIEGYLCVDDALVIACLMRWQSQMRLGGGAAEIGIYYGRLYFLLRLLLARAERAFAADLFDIDLRPAGPSGQLRRFRANAVRLGLEIAEPELHVGNSALLSGEEIVRRTGPVRFFSIDGGHGFADVAHDAAVACEAIAPTGSSASMTSAIHSGRR